MILDGKLIIPAAGFGTRVGSPMAKELLQYDNEPLIFHAIELARSLNIRCHVITRVEKENLIQYLKQFSHVDIQIIKPSKEWPDTILQSKEHWAENNILVLPDTRFSPENSIEKLFELLKWQSLSVAGFEVDSYLTWGCFNTKSEFYELVEKPNVLSFAGKNESDYLAWGLLGFKKEIGEELFSQILQSTFDHQIKQTSFKFSYFKLDHFSDLTR